MRLEPLSQLNSHSPTLCRDVFSLMHIRSEENAWLDELYRVLCARLFPEDGVTRPALSDEQEAYLSALERCFDMAPDGYDVLSDLLPLPEGALSGSRVAEQYGRFSQAVADAHLIALMRLGREIQPFDPASHTIGVHNVALHTAILAQKAGFAVDLPLVSAAALGHDIGKFGCRGEDAKRIPHLHYYYTWQWFSENKMEDIGYISANHSTWDLEFENLPIESLLLILADFRVRGHRENGKEIIRIYSLDEAYDIICSKLCDVTDEKLKRYQSVYSKLHDFEVLLHSRGVPTDITENELLPAEVQEPSLMDAEQALQALRSMTLLGDIRLMRTITTDRSLDQLLAQAKAEKNSQRIRTYMTLLEEYSTYMTKNNKQKTLIFLYELLMHPDGDVRRNAGRIMGQILANSGPKYRKEKPLASKKGILPPAMGSLLSESIELWKAYIRQCLHPDRKISPKHALRISNSLKTICQTLFSVCEEKEIPLLLQPLLDQVFTCEKPDRFVLIDALRQVPCKYLPEERVIPLIELLGQMLQTGELRLVMVVLDYLEALSHQLPHHAKAVAKLMQTTQVAHEEELAVAYLCRRLRGEPYRPLSDNEISTLHLSDLMNAVHWTVKITQIEMLCENTTRGDKFMFSTAMHLSNLLSVSEHLPVREAAGEQLLFIAPHLSTMQINEITIDLMRELETGQEQVSMFIPRYLGRLMALLPEKEWREHIDYLDGLVHGAAVRPAQVALYTLGQALNSLPLYRYDQADRLLGLLMTGVAHFNDVVHQTALSVLCRDVFSRDSMPMDRKHEMFVHLHKKLLTILSEPREGRLTRFHRASMLNHLYRYIVTQEVHRGPFQFPAPKKAAFFPGTFDPFSAGHKQIVEEIRRLGFEVYLAVDEFSWSKKTLPKLLRRQIVSISTADQSDTYLFPDDIPINIAMVDDLARLKALLPSQDVYLVAGSDVIFNASAYKSSEVGSAADYDHVVFCRNLDESGETELRTMIRGKLEVLRLPPFYETVSSTRIRQSIDGKLDISMLVDPVVQSFIYERGLYVRSPEMKNVLQQQDVFFRCHIVPHASLPPQVNELLKWKDAMAVSLCERPDILLGWAAGTSVMSEDLYDVLGTVEEASAVRRRASGMLLYIDQLSAQNNDSDMLRRLLNELLARSLEKGHTYALCRCGAENTALYDALSQLGFTVLEQSHGLYCVDMRAPVMLLQDVLLQIKKPHRDFPAVRNAVEKCRPRLRGAFNRMFPGKLLLCFDSELLNQTLMEHVMTLNGVQEVPSGVRQLGPYMCVPYGKIISDEIVPNTVTKTLHVEKCYDPDIRGFTIQEYPDYSPLRNQVRTLRSFRRPIILLDDLLHKGYRIDKLDSVLREENLETEKILVAVMSGYGRDLMRRQGREAQCEYFIPNLHYWATESLLYPFLGGDSVEGRAIHKHMLPSINMILPYFYPYYFTDATRDQVYDLSHTALENARDIMAALESVHQQAFSTALTIRDLGEALKQPRLPDKGGCMLYDFTVPASRYLEDDLSQLTRIWRKEEQRDI